ncbi:MAG TPA: MurR/RpiR family transcriptional regulator [Pseudonocardia sp.]|nr:MurR/RpiR family transcriptional regulator [Pseudonocardia sp.]
MTEAIAGPPATYQELRAQLQDRQPTMAPGQRRIARLLLDDPEGTAFRSIGETARLAQVHSSSLVRFAALFGLSGYPALVRLCREQLASEAQLVHRLERAQRHTATAELLGAVVEHDQRNLSRTFAQLDHADWDRVVELLADAPAVSVIGLRKCFSVAYLMSYLLHLVRPRVRQIGGGGGLLVDELRELGPSDVLVAVSIRRYARDTLRAVEYARRVGVVVVALTDDPSSPLARLADVTFYVSTAGVTVLRSLSVFTSVVQALATAVAVRLGTSSRDELLTDERLLGEFETYVEPS